MTKVEATQNYGARVEFVGAGFEEALAEAVAMCERHGATFIHAFEDEQVIAGQGTIGLELAEQVEGIETLIVPIGGGGLASGIALALKELRPEVRIVGVQAAAMAPFAGSTSFGWTIADGIAVKQPGELTSAILRDRLDDVVTVEDDEISEAIVLLLERLKLVAEGAGAASVAASARRARSRAPARTVALLSGGNIDPTLLLSVARHGLSLAGRSLVVPDACPRPARRAAQAARADRRRAGQHRRGRAPPRRRRAPGRRHRGGADADDARPRALRGADRRARGGRLPRQAPALTARRQRRPTRARHGRNSVTHRADLSRIRLPEGGFLGTNCFRAWHYAGPLRLSQGRAS